jgi:hypothetical protein
MTGQNVYV